MRLDGERPAGAPRYDVLVIGAGLSGMYQLHRVRQLGLAARVFEAGTGVGGTSRAGRRAPSSPMRAAHRRCDEVAAKGYEGFVLR
jgi:cation diffusion facilitator CzcD-associated flavoprotein CzcO